ncbi:Protein of unknown function (DUF3445) domain containing protein [Elaphomyces granulatus]
MITLDDAIQSVKNLLISWENLFSLPESGDQLKAKLAVLNNPQVIIALIMGVLLIWNARSKIRESIEESKAFRTLEAPDFPPIEPLENFDWKSTEPPKFRPFKPKYHLTMALETLVPSELIPMDKTFKERLEYRRSLLLEHHDTVIAVNNDTDPRIRAAVSELYTFLLGTYLPGRYPTMFKLHRVNYPSGKTVMLQNLVTEELWPVKLAKEAPTIRALETLIKTVDEDFLILLPEQDDEETAAAGELEEEGGETKYILEAFATGYPAGFDPRKKLGNCLARIHEPVPGYPERLEKSMDRFFDKLEVGKYVKRVNWGITTDAELFSAFGNKVHSSEGEVLEVIEPEDLNIDKTFLRCERQTIHRLPSSQALVFAFHTYLYPLQDIKDEGLGETLAQAIDGLKEGSTPEIHLYKRGPVWEKAVKAFLTS